MEHDVIAARVARFLRATGLTVTQVIAGMGRLAASRPSIRELIRRDNVSACTGYQAHPANIKRRGEI